MPSRKLFLQLTVDDVKDIIPRDAMATFRECMKWKGKKLYNNYVDRFFGLGFN